MTHDVNTLLTWAIGCLCITAVCVTAFPLMYAFSPWHKSPIGRALMIQAVAFMLAIDLTLAFQFWEPDDIVMAFWLNAIILTFVAIATLWLTIIMVQANYRKIKKRKKTNDSAEPRP